jgi:lipopolysaccharide transport protein LptA
MPTAEQLRPTGPVTVTAQRAELVQNSSAVYVGNVVLDSDTIRLDGDRLDLRQYPNGQYEAKVTGTPGHMSHPGAGPDNPPVWARANTLHYDSRTGVVDLLGDALFRRGSDEITGSVIHYNVIERRVEATGGDDGSQVRITINQAPPAAHSGPEPQTAPPAAAPAPAAPAAPAQKPPAAGSAAGPAR